MLENVEATSAETSARTRTSSRTTFAEMEQPQHALAASSAHVYSSNRIRVRPSRVRHFSRR